MSTLEDKMLFDYLFKEDHSLIAGFDEAGRGSLMGPIVAACVVLPSDFNITEINDSKKIKNDLKRTELANEIKKVAITYGIGIIHSREIEEIGIQKANFKAFQLAYQDMGYKKEGLLLLIDGNYKGINLDNYKSIVKGDNLSASIASASIIAKDTRDSIVTNICHNEFPMYGFDKNKGYGTKSHIEAIANYGLTEWHRPSFCKKPLQRIGGDRVE